MQICIYNVTDASLKLLSLKWTAEQVDRQHRQVLQVRPRLKPVAESVVQSREEGRFLNSEGRA